MQVVSIYTEDDRVVVEFDEDRNAVLELETDQERELMERLLGDVNLWHNFLSSLSAAMTQQLGSKNDQ